ncbi:hypothetical protein HHI36_022310 [Cryptolaemus montrouzieri]|uniref:Retrotransposon gag domain-containing protein n=3 Tax=Cryptolaemus montrouzieri TaxID=559131 RepID=A0ABD2MZP5_9CUCU
MAQKSNHASPNPSVDGNESDASENIEILPLSVLFKFIKPFTGDRNELHTFITNHKSTKSNQKPSLFLFVVSQLSTNVINEIDIQDIDSWYSLKTRLKLYYSQTKHVAQAHEELENLKQMSNENISNYFKRVEKTKNECIQAELLNSEANEFAGQKIAIQRTALRRFISHCRPEISQMLRARDIKTLNEAYDLALQEEKILNYVKPHKSTNLYCSICKMTNHPTQNCKKKKYTNSNQNTNPSTSKKTNDSQKSKYFCSFCKIPGHSIEYCRKKNSNPRVNHLNESGQSPMDVPEIQDQLQETFNDKNQNHVELQQMFKQI